MKFWIIAIAGIGLLFGCTKHVSTVLDQYQTIAAGNYVMRDAVLINNGWTKIFEENFDTDLDQWDIWTGGGCNNELQFYQPENLQLDNGVLEIRSKKENKTGRTLPSNPVLSNYEFTSGRIESKAKISACAETPRVRILARIRIPRGNGMWPAFWSYGHPWPTQGEIDLLEARGNEPDRYYTNYYFGTSQQLYKENVSATISLGVDLSQNFHVYEMEWTANSLTSYLDGILVETKTAGTHLPDLFGKSQHLVLNLAVGGNFFNDLDISKIETGTLYVDWVKVFTAK